MKTTRMRTVLVTASLKHLWVSLGNVQRLLEWRPTIFEVRVAEPLRKINVKILLELLDKRRHVVFAQLVLFEF